MKITESELSKSLNVSRAVVREAIVILVQEGLLEKVTNRYTKVAEYTQRDIRDIFDLRSVLEIGGARYCIQQPEIVKKLQEREHVMVEINAYPPIDKLALVYADMNIHTLIIQEAGNQRLLEAWNRILSPLLRLIYSYVLRCTEESSLGSISYDHSDIIQAFAKRDWDEVSRVLMSHTELMRDILLNSSVR